MSKRFRHIAMLALMSFSLVACDLDIDGTNFGRRSDEPLTTAQYYANIDQPYDHDGPIVESYDRTYGAEGQEFRKRRRDILSLRDEKGNPPMYRSNTGKREYWISRKIDTNKHETNYHDQYSSRSVTPRPSYYQAYEGKLATDIANKAMTIDNVRDARVVITPDKVFVALHLNDTKRASETSKNVEKVVKQSVKDRKPVITTNIGSFYKMRVIDNDLRSGE